MSIARNIVAICSERAAGARVRRVTMEIGALSAVLPDSLQFCFPICAQGTPLEGAALRIVEVAGEAVCSDCGASVALHEIFGICDCGSRKLRIVAGDGIRIKEMEVA
jgi:hydrogenase nickel incorporation protein HypA/HybF